MDEPSHSMRGRARELTTPPRHLMRTRCAGVLRFLRDHRPEPAPASGATPTPRPTLGARRVPAPGVSTNDRRQTVAAIEYAVTAPAQVIPAASRVPLVSWSLAAHVPWKYRQGLMRARFGSPIVVSTRAAVVADGHVRCGRSRHLSSPVALVKPGSRTPLAPRASRVREAR